ncbi:hypothetical protein B0J17DRAFT_719846 [Rhizoctonia solani]|nr:hypothetical protein B0J17DRAFT_719846 [Rhizoctonia solani]
MLDELRTASGALSAALDRYFTACISIKQQCSKGVSGMSQEAANLITNEHLLINSYKTKLRQADAAVSIARNVMLTMIITNILPDEILSRVFHFAAYGEPCQFHNTYEYSAYPLLFTHVCSRWRQVAMNSPTLWSHIDISSHGFRGSDIHIAENFPYGLYIGDLSLTDFLVPLVKRIRSLEIHVELDDRHRADASVLGDEFCDDILFMCLMNCTPGVLKHLMVVPKGGANAAFVEAEDAPDNGGQDDGTSLLSIRLKMQEQGLENILSPITHLKLNGRYSYWSSQAYHGLIELRLYPSNGWIIYIPDSQFTTMLAASPQLEILEFGLQVRSSTPRPLPVSLNNLRNLIMDTTEPMHSSH